MFAWFLCLTSESAAGKVYEQDCSRSLLSLVIFLKHLTAVGLKLHVHYRGCTCGCLKQKLIEPIGGFV